MNDVAAQYVQHLLDQDVVDPFVRFQAQRLGLADQHALVDVGLLDETPLIGRQRRPLLGLDLQDPVVELRARDLDDVVVASEHGTGDEQAGCEEQEV